MPPALDATGLRKRYGATVALDGVELKSQPGEVHALLGENGAGKSTVVKILSGLVQPDDGTVLVDGRPMPFGDPRSSRASGVRTAFQELTAIRDLTVTQSFLLGEEPRGVLGLVRVGEAHRQVAAALDRLGLPGIDPRAMVGDLDLPSRQKIEIARAISRNPKLLLLDEPTAALSARDVQWLGDLIRRLKADGASILFISHRMGEVREFCDTITILRNGRSVASHAVSAITDDEVIEATIGRSLGSVYPTRPPPPPKAGTPALAALDLVSEGALANVSLDLDPGRIMGVGALEGMGQRDLFLALFGLRSLTGGEIRIDGQPTWFASSRDAIRAGIGFVPEDRKTEGLFLDLTGGDNAALPNLPDLSSWGLVDSRRQEEATSAAFRSLQLADRARWSPARVFSGGNQQKIVLAKWLLTGSRTLLLYDPTRGVDIGTKAEIYALMQRFVEAGGSILFYSTEIAELVHMCDDVLVLYRGAVAARLSGAAISEAAIMRAALGQGGGGMHDGRH
jgi:ribose transport system ATP-binding protein